MATHRTGVLVYGASFGPGGARAFSERAVSEKFFDFPGKIRSETPKITGFEEERLEKRVVKNARPSVTTHSKDTPTKLGSSV